jgi:hypothetical protein
VIKRNKKEVGVNEERKQESIGVGSNQQEFEAGPQANSDLVKWRDISIYQRVA